MTKSLDQVRKAARLIAQCERGRRSDQRLERVARRVRKLSGAAQRRDA